jgi:hypothetical protein
VQLELDHIFCMVDDLDQTAHRLERDGWVLDPGTVHVGQGTRNRRLPWSEQYLELLCVIDDPEARSSRLRMDRRARWDSTGASPFGLGFRGSVPDTDRDDFWLYEELGARIWINHDNERFPTRPLLFVVETFDEAMEQRRPRFSHPDLLAHRRTGALREVHISGPASVSLPTHAGPPIVQTYGPHHLELAIGRQGPAPPMVPITPILTIHG